MRSCAYVVTEHLCSDFTGNVIRDHCFEAVTLVSAILAQFCKIDGVFQRLWQEFGIATWGICSESHLLEALALVDSGDLQNAYKPVMNSTGPLRHLKLSQHSPRSTGWWAKYSKVAAAPARGVSSILERHPILDFFCCVPPQQVSTRLLGKASSTAVAALERNNDCNQPVC